MRAGGLDELVGLYRPVKTRDPRTGEELVGYDLAGERFADFTETRGDERFRADQFVGQSRGRFELRYDCLADLALVPAVEWRVAFNGLTWDVIDAQRVGRGVKLVLWCVARSERAQDAPA